MTQTKLPPPPAGQIITLMGESMPECGDCGRRLIVDTEPSYEDSDGPIFKASCSVHGETLVQDDPEEDSPDEEG